MTAPEAVREIAGPLVEREGGGPPGWDAQLSRFLELLLERNRSVNLVSRRTAHRALEDHVLPSLALLRVIPPDYECRLLDIGSGGGFPAIPLKILRPRVRVDLLEATRKKCDFLEVAVLELSLSESRVHWGRVEAPPDGLVERGPFDLATARAVGNHERIARAAARLVRDGGPLWVFAAPEDAESVVARGDGALWEDIEGRPLTGLKNMLARP